VTHEVLGGPTEPGATGAGSAVSEWRGHTSPAAFAALIARHDVHLRSLAYRLLGSREEMQDAMQDAYLAAFRGLDGFRGEAAPATWLYRIVYTTSLRHLKRRRQAPIMLSDDAVSTPDPADAVAARHELACALKRLPVEQRVAVLLVDGQGFSYKAAGEVLGVPAGTVASRLSHGRAELRASLGPR